MADLDFKGLAESLLGRAASLLQDWLPGGKVSGHEYVCAGLDGGKGRSFSVNVQTGKWSEFNGVQDLKGGDLTSLYAAIKGITQGEAFKELAAQVGIASTPAAPPPPKITVGPPPADTPAPTLAGATMSWCYRDKAGAPLFYVARFEGKDGKEIRPVSWDLTEKKWVYKGYNEPRPLYGLELLAARPNDPVMVVEGEKAADAARTLAGDLYVVITWPNGAQAINKADWKPLHGRKLLLWPDADAPGAQAMATVAEKLGRLCPEIKILDTSSKPAGWDAADAIAEGWTWPWVRQFADGRLTLYVPPVEPDPEAELVPEPPEAMADVAAVATKGRAVAGARATAVVHVDDGEATGQRDRFAALWAKTGLQVTKAGAVANVDNVMRVLENRPDLEDLIWFDEFHQKFFTRMDFRAWENDEDGRAWRDVDNLYLMAYMQRHLGMTKISEPMVEQALRVTGHNNTKNEPKEWLDSLVWDGVERIEAFFAHCFGCEGTDYSYAVSRNFWIAMVARLLDPGCQVDNMVILEGDQGNFKSSALRLIGHKWGVECRDNILSKDFNIGLQGKGLVIINEWDKFKKTDASHLKDIITTPADSYRPLFGKHHMTHRRTCIFIATTNRNRYLLDSTGARRYWPLKTTQINKKSIIEMRDQCYAEAVHRFRAGEKWHEMPGTTKDEQEARREMDEWEPEIEAFLGEQLLSETTILEIARDCIKLPLADLNQTIKNRIGDCLRVLGWDSITARRNNKTVQLYTKRGGRDGNPEN